MLKKKITSGLVCLVVAEALIACGSTSFENDLGEQGQGGGMNEATDGQSDGAAGDTQTDGGGNGNPACEVECSACPNDMELVQCESTCVCESTDAAAKADHALLLECPVDEPCSASNVSQDPGRTSWENGDCLLSALRDRTPGRYAHTTTVSDIGGSMLEYTLLLDGSDDLIVSSVSTAWDSNTRIRYQKTQRCSLVSYEVLEQCLATGTGLSPTTTGGGPSVDEACTQLGDWITGCEDVDASCPTE